MLQIHSLLLKLAAFNLGILAGIVDNAHAQIQQFCAAFRLQADFAAAAFYIIDIVGNAEPVAQLGCCDAF